MNSDIQQLINEYGILHQHSNEVLDYSNKVHKQINDSNSSQRKDLRDVYFITIDGADAKDFDDAVFCEKLANNKGYKLIVAIADVSYYVKHNDLLDLDARNRGTSVYFPNYVIPMLPKNLSEDLCSLVPNQDRNTLACEIYTDSNGNLKSYKFFECLINSKKRLTYESAQNHLESKTNNEVGNILFNLQALVKKLEALRIKRNALMIESSSAPPVVINGKVQNNNTRLYSHKMIEEAMLLANICAAKFLQENKYPSLYRVHNKPGKEKITRLLDLLANLNIHLGNLPTIKIFQEVIKRIEHMDGLIKKIVTSNLLRSLERAVYTPNNVGHFGLGYKSYTHFTSPIRRYPDLMVHRAIKDILYNNKKDILKLAKNIAKIGAECSERELAADRASWDYSFRQLNRLLINRKGQVYPGVISGFCKSGMFVSIDDGFEGMVRFDTLSGDYYQLNKFMTKAIGRSTRKAYYIGMAVKIKIADVNLDTGKSSFTLVKKK